LAQIGHIDQATKLKKEAPEDFEAVKSGNKTIPQAIIGMIE